MKVCTDACLFGSLVAGRGHPAHANSRVLDIGTGTGLLALMFAQKNPNAIIDTVEIDNDAAQQAKENFEASPWKERLNAYSLSIQDFISTISNRYDLIISNPPFYENELNSEDEKRNLALHSTELTWDELIFATDKLLTDDGTLLVLLPYHRTQHFEQSALKQKLFIKEKVFVRQTPKHNYFRSILQLTRQTETAHQSEITITHNNQYSKEFAKLLEGYYLNL